MEYLQHCLLVQGGGIQPKVLECKVIGDFGEKKSNGGTQWYQQDRVYEMGDVSMCLPSQLPGGSYNYIECKEYDVVAMRGRDPENPSDRKPRNPNLEQILEIREDGCTNTLTTVQKDNMVLETVGYLGDKRRQSTAVYSEEGVANTLSTAHGSGNGYILVKQATKEGTIKCDIGGVVDLNYPDSQTRRGRVQGNGQISPTLTTENIPSVLEPWIWEIDGVTYLIRIRKLTPRECWRLMSFSDEDFEKAKFRNEKLYLEGGERKCNAKLRVVNESQRHENMETYVSCTIKDIQDMEILKTINWKSAEMLDEEKKVNVSIVTEKSEKTERSECAISTTKCITFMGMHFTLTEEKDRHLTVIIAQVKKDKQNTEKCMKIITESNLSQTKLYTILTLFAQIIELKIFTSTTVQVNIRGCIAITENCENNILMQISNLEMENISELSSNTAMYKQAGNSIVTEVLCRIFEQMF